MDIAASLYRREEGGVAVAMTCKRLYNGIHAPLRDLVYEALGV